MKELWNRLMNDPKTARKFILALIAAVGIAVSQGLLPASVAMWIAVLGPFLTAAGVYAVPNKPDNTNGPQNGSQSLHEGT